jgi:transposase-like protein
MVNSQAETCKTEMHPMGFSSFNTVRRTIKGYEIMNMLRKGQVKEVERGAVRERVKFIAEIFGVVA